MLFSHSRLDPGLAVLKVYKQKQIEKTPKNTCKKSVRPMLEGLDIGVKWRAYSYSNREREGEREKERERQRQRQRVTKYFQEPQNRKCYTKVLTHAELRQLLSSQIFRTV